MTGDMEDQWRARPDKNLGVTSLSINSTRVRFCLLHVGIYCVPITVSWPRAAKILQG